ncbi:MAG: Ig-like domain-containing protein [Rhodospirillaceae bacterium]|nr:Ig-like domain-containing protein [Rhodospirillaceae bacterium]
MSFLRTLGLLGFSIFLCACGSGGSDPPQITSVVVTPGSAMLLAPGDTVQLQAAARDSNGRTVTAQFDWMSSDTSVATVDSNGLVTAQGSGTTTITAESGHVSGSSTVTVQQRVASVTISDSGVTFSALGETAQLEATARDENDDPVSVATSWTSSDTSVATVDNTGLVTSRGNGVATITVTSGAFSASAEVAVDQRISTLSIEPLDLDSAGEPPVRFTSIGETIQFTVELLDSNGHAIEGLLIAAESEDRGIVDIDGDLLATAVANGTTLIRFIHRTETGSISRQFAVSVRQVTTDIRIAPTARTFQEVNETHQFTAIVTDAEGHALSDDLLYWESTDRRVADVDETGLVTVRGNGTSEIIVRVDELSGGISASATVEGALRASCRTGPKVPLIARLQPESLVEGAVVSIEGTGFCDELSGNLVTIDRMVAEILTASETALTVTVPQYHCLPSRDVALTVDVGGNSATRPVGLRPDEPTISLDVGQQVVYGTGINKCIQFMGADVSESYLIGVQSTLLPWDFSFTKELTPVRLTASTNSPESGSAISMDTPQRNGSNSLEYQAPTEPPTRSWFPGSGRSEQIPGGHFYYPPFVPSSGLAAAADATPDIDDLESLPNVGDIVLQYGREYYVYEVGSHAIWLVELGLEDVIRTEHSDRMTEFSEGFDDQVYPAIINYFGAPPDLGRLDRVVVLIYGVHGHIATGAGKIISIALNFSLAAFAHELTHIVQGQNYYGNVGRPNWPIWFTEGQATLGEEVYAFAVSGHSPASNYGLDVASVDPVASRLRHLGIYFGGAHPQKPQECTWTSGYVVPCELPNSHYSGGWSFLRWLTDQYGRRYPGAEQNFHRELIVTPAPLRDGIERLLGETMETLLARFAAALYVDDRISDADPTLQFTSWNFAEIFSGDHEQFTPIVPLELPFENLQSKARIRDGSMWYLLAKSQERHATAIRVTNQADGALPDELQVWVVRLE